MATVEKRGKKWSVRYWVTDSLGNRTGQKRVSGFLTKEDAMAAARDLERTSNAGIDVHGDIKTCGELMELWFAAKVGKIAETTLSKYSGYMDILQARPVYTTPIRKLNRNSLDAIISDLMEARGVSVRSATCYTEPLRFAVSWGLKQGIIPINPFFGASKPKAEDPGPLKILSQDDVETLIRECKTHNPHFLIPLYLALYGGLRAEESAGLTWEAVDFDHSCVRITSAETRTYSGKRLKKAPKTRSSKRTVSLPSFVMDALLCAKAKHLDAHVCISRKGVPYSLSTYGHAVLDLVDQINTHRAPDHQMARVSYHDLRHTHAAMLIRLGVQPKVISERLGHTSIKITMDLYGYLMPGLQEDVARALEDLG